MLEQGDLLFLSQSATHEVCKAEETDVAVNFIVLPVFKSSNVDGGDEHNNRMFDKYYGYWE